MYKTSMYDIPEPIKDAVAKGNHSSRRFGRIKPLDC